MIPDEEDIREYAKYAAKVREIVQEEISKSAEKIDPNLLSEISRSATMPIGIWVEQKGRQFNHNGSHMNAEEEKAEVDKLFARFDLVENEGHVRPRKGLSHDDFLTLKNMFLELGYTYESGKGFLRGKDI
jgi:hypothetical protein